ncbi:hypothetical protein DFH06DRAFT_1124273 [Mycena polygramma]|nr:hypothetical protein DFH06DRAFT_1124273 [Mycena polygramma]
MLPAVPVRFNDRGRRATTALHPTRGSPHRSSFGSPNTHTPPRLNQFLFGSTTGSARLDNDFLSPDIGLRRSKSDAAARLSHGESDLMRGSGGKQFLSPVDGPPSIRKHGHYRSSGATRCGSWSTASSQRPSLYLSAEPERLPRRKPLGPASRGHEPKRRRANRGVEADGFARQHDCKQHEKLHTNYQPFMCDGCNKQYARMDALNRHLRSEDGAECQRMLEASENMGARG